MTPNIWTLEGNSWTLGGKGRSEIVGRHLWTFPKVLRFFSCEVANQLLFDTQMQINFDFKIYKACYQRKFWVLKKTNKVWRNRARGMNKEVCYYLNEFSWQHCTIWLVLDDFEAIKQSLIKLLVEIIQMLEKIISTKIHPWPDLCCTVSSIPVFHA